MIGERMTLENLKAYLNEADEKLLNLQEHL